MGLGHWGIGRASKGLPLIQFIDPQSKIAQAALDDDLEQDSLRAPLLGQQDRRPQSPKSGPNSPKGPPSGGSVARVVGGDGQNGGSSRR